MISSVETCATRNPTIQLVLDQNKSTDFSQNFDVSEAPVLIFVMVSESDKGVQ